MRTLEQKARPRGFPQVCVTFPVLLVALAAQPVEAGIKVEGSPAFKKIVADCIAHMKATGGTAKAIVEQLESSNNEHIIETLKYQTAFVSQCDPTSPAKAKDPSSGGSDSVITWGYTSAIKFKDGVQEVPCKTLLHEMKHSALADTGKVDATPGHNNITKDEIEATKAENEFRVQQKKKHPPRKKYGNADLPKSAIPEDEDDDEEEESESGEDGEENGGEGNG